MIVKSKKEKEFLKKSGQILARVLMMLEREIKPGIEASKLDDIADREIKKAGALPSFKNYREGKEKPYPASVCISINDEIVHGIPAKKFFKEGDVVGLDLGVNYKGFFTDGASTVVVGKGDEKTKKLIDVCRKALDIALEKCRAGVHIGDIGHAVESFVEESGFKVFRELVGHGVGSAVHEDPQIPNWGTSGTGEKLKEGEVLAIEPMISEGEAKIILDKDGWTYRTRDGSRAAHFEHTILVKKDGCEVLTKIS